MPSPQTQAEALQGCSIANALNKAITWLLFGILKVIYFLIPYEKIVGGKQYVNG
ncbi:MAG: hypothetical protein H6Q68_3095 [Firmicutes bacterium]|nr:hypothetical protein [Bacillota bacterium]